jgi:hypothetical protein
MMLGGFFVAQIDRNCRVPAPRTYHFGRVLGKLRMKDG